MPRTIPSIPVFFRPEMVAQSASFSPSAGKPPQVVNDWLAASLPADIRRFDPVDAVTLSLAHDPAHVRAVLSCEAPNGFGNRRADVAASLPFTSSAMLAAAREAIANRRVACAPVLGFHHARYLYAAGYCTFNGLMVTALALRRDDGVARVGILDLDHHWGDGTDEILRRLGIDWVQHHSAGLEYGRAEQAEPHLAELEGLVRSFEDCEVLIYQAGADAHVDDPLGGWMTDDQLSERDRIVFQTAADIGLPVAWNLAGGYQTDASGGIEPVLRIHCRTMEACVAVFVGR